MGSLVESPSPSGDIAVIGLSCRFPGGASNAAKFWDLLQERKSAYSEVPQSRYNASAFHHPGGKLNTLSSRGGHFLDEDVSAFDAPFFNITAHEAKAMDPTARFLLEVTYEALENAGLAVEDLAGSDTSCYVGCFTRDFHEMLMRDTETSPMYAGTGTGFSLLSNRVSWFYDFRGPSLTLDTACSSSLVGLHLACQGLRTGESKLAVVSGANLILSPDLAIFLSNLHMLSKEGLSRSFADGTSGYGRGEGVATVVLKPLADALRDGDPIRAVLRGTGVNQDGHTTGITVPNSDAQAELIRSTYRSSGLDYAQTTYFEAHGTGTSVGDPLELAAVARTLGAVRHQDDHLLVGSVKSNIGHLEGAAGLAGVIKCILMLEQGVILPNIHFDRPNKRIPFDTWKLKVPTSCLPWPSNSLRRASVNSFGYGGTNAHAILDDATEYLALRGLQDSALGSQGTGDQNPHPRVFVVSARDEAALDRMRKQYSGFLEAYVREGGSKKSKVAESESSYLDRLAFTLSERRSQFDWKAHVVASSIQELQEKLSASALQAVRSSTKSRIAFVFTGQGAQWARMGLELLRYPTFRASVVDADQYLKQTLGCEWSVIEELEKEGSQSNIQLAKISQPLCTILQVALVDLLESWNVTATGVVGHSSGEIGAAYTYGAISREDAWTISYWRGHLCSALAVEAPELRGSMMAVGLSPEAAQDYISGLDRGKVVVACVNSPSSVTISGDEAAIDQLDETLKANSVFCRKLKVENAYHSHHMARIAQRYLDKISHLTAKFPPSTQRPVTMVSSVTGNVIAPSDLGPAYWVRNLVSPVLFSSAVQALFTASATQRKRRARGVDSNFEMLLEVGPHAALKGPLRQILQDQGIQNVGYKSVILRGEDAVQTAVDCAGGLYTQGVSVSIAAVNQLATRLKPMTDLPPYPWNHALKYWSESRLSKNYRFREHGRHDLLGALALGYNELEPKWRHFLRVSENPWIRDHVVHSTILYPAAGIIAMPLEAIKQVADKDRSIEKIQMKHVHITKAIVVPDDPTGVECFLQFRRQRAGANRWTEWWEFSVFTSLEGQPTEENGFGLVGIQYKDEQLQPWADQASQTTAAALKQQYEEFQTRCPHRIEPKDFYEATKVAGLNYGPSFQGLTEIATGNNCCCVTVAIPDTKGSMPANMESPHTIHPTTLDIIFHALFSALANSEGEVKFENAAVPVFFESLSFAVDLPSGANAEFHGFCTAKKDGPREIVADICMFDKTLQEPKVQVQGLRCRELPGAAPTGSPGRSLKAPFGTLEWKPDMHLCSKQGLQQYLSVDQQSSLTRLDDQIHKAVDLIAHKNPDLSILQLGGPFSTTQGVLSTLADGPRDTARFSKFLVADVDSTNKAAEFEKTFESSPWGSKLAFTQLNQDLDLVGPSLEAASFDLIIITAASFGGDDPSQKARFLSQVSELLRAGGVLLTLDSLPEGSGDNGWETTVLQASLSPVGLFHAVPADSEETSVSHPPVMGLATKPYARQPDTNYSETVYVIYPPHQTGKTSDTWPAVMKSLSKWPLSAQAVTWPPTNVEELKGKSIISLLELEEPFLADLSADDYDLLRPVVLDSASFLWVSMGNDPTLAAPMGYLRVLKNENPNLDLRYLAVEDKAGRGVDELAGVITHVALDPNPDREFAEIDGRVCISRWTPNASMSRMILDEEDPVVPETMALGATKTALRIATSSPGPGAEQSVYFTTTTNDDALALEPKIQPDEVEIVTRAVAMSTQGSLSSTKEFSGIVKSVGAACSRIRPGDRVYACQTGPYQSIYRVKEGVCHRIPGTQTFEEAATWPVTWGTAYQSLVRVANLRPGQSILIQTASCAVGQAAIKISQALGAVVFATVRRGEEEDEEEASRLVEKKYGIPRQRIIHDADPDLGATVNRLSQGKGFDVVMINNTLNDTDGHLQTLWRCGVAPFGHLIVSTAASNKTPPPTTITSAGPGLDMSPFQKGCRFSVVDLDLILRESFSMMIDISRGLADHLATRPSNPVHPLNVFSASQVGEAFEFVRQRPEIGSGHTVLSLNEQDQIPIHPAARNPLVLHQDASYIVVGGTGGLGRSLARLLVDHGARHLVFVSRSGLKSASARSLVEDLSTRGVEVKAYACDVADETAMRQALDQVAQEMPPVRGVIQSAAVLNDAIYNNMTYELWQGATRPKIQGTWLLHRLLPRDMKLDFFVMLSSIAGVVGNRSQANYAAGNTFQDALARFRRDQGLAAVAVDLGLMSGIGLIAERGGFTNLRKSEAVALDEADFHAIMTAAMVGSYGHTVLPAQLVTGLPTGGLLHRQSLDPPFYYHDPRFLFLKKMDLEVAVREEAGSSSADQANQNDISNSSSRLATELSEAKSLREASKVISDALCGLLAKGLQTAAANIDTDKALHFYGVDSLMAVEIRTWILQHIKADITLFDVLSGGSLSILAIKIATVSKLTPIGLE